MSLHWIAATTVVAIDTIVLRSVEAVVVRGAVCVGVVFDDIGIVMFAVIEVAALAVHVFVAVLVAVVAFSLAAFVLFMVVVVAVSSRVVRARNCRRCDRDFESVQIRRQKFFGFVVFSKGSHLFAYRYLNVFLVNPGKEM